MEVRIARKLVDRAVPGPSTKWGWFVPRDSASTGSFTSSSHRSPLTAARASSPTTAALSHLFDIDPWLNPPRAVRCILLARSTSSPPFDTHLARSTTTALQVISSGGARLACNPESLRTRRRPLQPAASSLPPRLDSKHTKDIRPTLRNPPSDRPPTANTTSDHLLPSSVQLFHLLSSRPCTPLPPLSLPAPPLETPHPTGILHPAKRLSFSHTCTHAHTRTTLFTNLHAASAAIFAALALLTRRDAPHRRPAR